MPIHNAAAVTFFCYITKHSRFFLSIIVFEYQSFEIPLCTICMTHYLHIKVSLVLLLVMNDVEVC